MACKQSGASYEEVYEAVSATPSGRCFLDEFARRNRTADTDRILGALERAKTQANGSSSKWQAETDELDAVVSATEAATAEILAAAEEIQIIARGLNEPASQALIACSNQIITACSFQDITGSRTRRIAAALRNPGHVPRASEAARVSQSEIDEFLETWTGPELDDFTGACGCADT